MRIFKIKMPNRPECNQKLEVVCKISKKSGNSAESCCGSVTKATGDTNAFIKRTIFNMMQSCGCVSGPEDMEKYLKEKGISFEDCCKGSDKNECCPGFEVTEVTSEDEKAQCCTDADMTECCKFVINCN